MNITSKDSLVDLLITFTWKKHDIRHTEIYFADEVNLYRDYFPQSIAKDLIGKFSPDTITRTFTPGQLIPSYSDKEVHRLHVRQLDMRRLSNEAVSPMRGRYYPKGIINGFPGIFSENIIPFRIIDHEGDSITVDFNHPLSGLTLDMSIDIIDIKSKTKERGGIAYDWVETALSGPGIQSRIDHQPTEFYSVFPLSRNDTQPDSLFYAKERMVSHIDALALEHLAGIYKKRIRNGSSVLDLMSSWQSHLPDDLACGDLMGIGMNEHELRQNPKLTRHVVHDLNRDPSIPCPDNTFDTVICSLSVEYLIHPVDVFKDVARVLKPGGSFIVTFSNRWFPAKAIDIWPFLHEFERMGLVLEYFNQSDAFNHLETMSLRGYPRPYDDTYFPGVRMSDPIYLVQGVKK